MAIIYEKKIFRNLQEQVEKNKQDIVDLQQTEMALNAYGIKVVGQVETALDIPEDFEGDYGDAYLVGDEAPYDVYVWTRPNSETPEDHFVDIGPIAIVGPMGPQGPQGEKGDTGDQGIGWITGTNQTSTNYPAGTLMFNGLSGDIYKLVNGAWVYIGNIKGPQGVQGQQGPQGETGATGAQGPQGPKGDTGASYQVIGTYAATANLPDPTLVNPGSAALVGADAPYELYIVVGATQDAQQWVDAGVFNDQAPDGTSCLVIEVSNWTNTMAGGTTYYSLSADELSVLIDSFNKPCYIVEIDKDSKDNYNYTRSHLFAKNYEIKDDRSSPTSYGFHFDCLRNEEHYICYLSGSNLIFQRVSKIELQANKQGYINSNSSSSNYPSVPAVYSYCNPYFLEIPMKSAVITISGIADSNSLVLTCFASQQKRTEWLSFANTLMSTNYTFAQMLTYLQTTLNSLGQAPATNESSILQLLGILVGMQLLNGRTEVKLTDNGIDRYLKVQCSFFSPAESRIGLFTYSDDDPPVQYNFISLLDMMLYGSPSSITDSDEFIFAISNPGNVS